MVEKLIEPLMTDSGKLVSIDFVVIHNDAGRMNPKEYIDWLRGEINHLVLHTITATEELLRKY